MKRRTITLAAVLALSISLSACGGDNLISDKDSDIEENEELKQENEESKQGIEELESENLSSEIMV